MQTIREPARDVPVVWEGDVVVAGGGPGGIMAALGAARAGARTALIERYGFLGGTATAGLMTSFNGFRNEHRPDHVQTVRGYAQEMVDRLLAAGGACACTAHGRFDDLRPGVCPYAVSFDPEVLKRVALEMLVEAGVALHLHTVFSAAPAGERRVLATIVENKSGRQALRGRVYVDATGDGDLAARAGARYEKAPPDGQRMMGMTLMYRVVGLPEPCPDERRLWANGITTRWGPGVGGLDGSDAEDYTRAELQTRTAVAEHVAKLREQHPDAQLVETAATVGVRETRRVVGLYCITEEDALTGRAQRDSVAVSSNPVPNYYGKRYFFDHLGFEIPYRSLVPADLDNVLLAGRCISASQPAFQSARSMAPCMAISQASGTAAALCARGGHRPADLDVVSLQRRLEQDGAVVRIPPEERGSTRTT
jgi:2-polyprenyl-6-methoxyphenol hydroxylase-like FAD-dependent oxidoreductase